MIGAAMVLPVMLYMSATSALFSLAVWEYANHGVQGGPFSAEDLQRPFSRRRANRQGATLDQDARFPSRAVASINRRA
jgi:hypothetical protein